jgi:hypothetical protein
MPFAAASALGLKPSAAAIDHSVSPGWTVCGVEAEAIAQIKNQAMTVDTA